MTLTYSSLLSKTGITADIYMDKWNRGIPDVKGTVEELWPSKCSKKKMVFTYGHNSYGKGKHSVQAPQHEFARS